MLTCMENDWVTMRVWETDTVWLTMILHSYCPLSAGVLESITRLLFPGPRILVVTMH